MRSSPTGLSSWLALLCVPLLCGLAGPAAAQQPSKAQADAVRQSCRADYRSHCSDVPTGGMPALQCLKDHLAELSPPCQTAVGAAAGAANPSPPATTGKAPASKAPPPSAAVPQLTPREEAGLMRRSCGDDFRAYCSGVRLGGGRGLACLVENESRLSPACKGALAEARAGQ